MELKRLLELAGIQPKEGNLKTTKTSKYKEPKADNKVKSGGENVTSKEGKLGTTNKAKYSEPKANHAAKTGGENVKAPKEGKGKSADGSKYNEPKANNKVKSGGESVKSKEGKLTVAKTSKYADNTSTEAYQQFKQIRTFGDVKNLYRLLEIAGVSEEDREKYLVEKVEKCACGCDPATCKCPADCKCGCNAVKEEQEEVKDCACKCKCPAECKKCSCNAVKEEQEEETKSEK